MPESSKFVYIFCLYILHLRSLRYKHGNASSKENGDEMTGIVDGAIQEGVYSNETGTIYNFRYIC